MVSWGGKLSIKNVSVDPSPQTPEDDIDNLSRVVVSDFSGFVSHVFMVHYICCFSPFIQDVLLANVVTIFIYCIYTVYKYSIYTVHGALARQMKMF